MASLKDRWRVLRPIVVSDLLYGFVRTVGATLKVTAEGFDPSQPPAIYCGWHGRSFVFAHFFRRRNWWVIISHSKDGDMQNHVFTKLGFRTIRGSTKRGGVRAAVEAIRALKSGGSLAMTPDGPRGPSGEVQGGVMLMAQKSGAPLIPVGVSASPRWLAKSWDRFLIPLPFAKGMLIAGEPIYVPPDASPEQVEEIRRQLERAMNEVETAAEGRLGH
jgi:lysophospholipid acyltransferase (LPLAT)-like uncharacterized protein